MNPLLSKVKLPGRVFQLPSKGLFYRPGVLAPNVTDGEVTIKPMSALMELTLRSPDMLFSGKALEEVCAECAPDILQPNKLITKDVDALFCFLRIVTYGSTLDTSAMHTCEKARIHTYQVNLELITGVPNNAALDSRDVMYQVRLTNGQTVKLKPITFGESLKLSNLQRELQRSMEGDRDPGKKELHDLMVEDLLSVIEGVEAEIDDKKVLITDRIMLEEWARSLQRKWIDEISAQASRSNEWGFNLTQKLKCKDCGAEFEHNLDLDPMSFFTG